MTHDPSHPSFKLEVEISTLVHTTNGVKIECRMSDGSLWNCDFDGTNWRKSLLSIDELTKRFHEEINKGQTDSITQEPS